MSDHYQSGCCGRRDFLRLGALGIAGFSLADAIALGSPARSLQKKKVAKSAIMIWLDGGLSHIDTLDAKPDAPAEFRGAWNPVPTPLPGVFFGEGMGRLAALAPEFALIRSLNMDAGEHEIARHYMLTGYPQTPALDHPGHGSVVSHFVKNPVFPPYVALNQNPDSVRQMGAGFLPADAAPMVIDENPARPEFTVRDLVPPAGVGAGRVARRRDLMLEFDRFRKDYEQNEAVRARSTAFERAFELVSTRASREAFDLSKEKPATRAKYGDHSLGQGCLLARRLVEAGARFVTVSEGGYDHHDRVHEQLTRHRIPKLEDAIPALMQDLRERGLLDDTVVFVMTEFGRTPRLNARMGRDHWPRVNVAWLAGAGVKRGAVIGATDLRGEQVIEQPVSPADMAATIYTLLGIDPEAALLTPDGRPVKLVQNGTPVAGVLA